MWQQNRYKTVFFSGVMAAFLLGLAVPELIHMGSGTYSGFCSIYSFSLFERMEIHSWDLFFYILKIRTLTLLFLWMSTYTAAGVIFHIIYIIWLAVSAGMLLALFALRDGYEGLALLACCLLPQWIMYAALIKQESAVLVRRKKERISGRKDLAELTNMMFLCGMGCACEAFLGTWTLKIFLQFQV